jgi:hypothetical protein
VATSDRLEFRSEPSGVATESGASNATVRTRVPIDPEALPPVSEKSGPADSRNLPKGAPEHAGGVDLSEFPSEEKGGRNQAADAAKIVAAPATNVVRPSLLVIERCEPIITREGTRRSIVEPASAIEKPRERGKSDRHVPVSSVPLRQTLPAQPAIRTHIQTTLRPFVSGVAVGVAAMILLIALAPRVMTLAGFSGAVSPSDDTRTPKATAPTSAKAPDKPTVFAAAAVPSITPTAAAVAPPAIAPTAKQKVPPAAPAPPNALPVAGRAVTSNTNQQARAVGRVSTEPNRAAAVGDVSPEANRVASTARGSSEPTAAATTRRVPVEPSRTAPSTRAAGESIVTAASARVASEAARAEASPPSRQPGVAPRPGPVSPQFLGSLAVSSTPSGAQVFVNSVLVGVTPLLLRDLPVGSRVVRVELDGHARWSAAIRIVADERTVVAAKLLPSPAQ